MNVAFLSLGGNMGNRMANLSAAINTISAVCGKPVKVSSVYETAAWGSESENKYLNQVVEITTTLSIAQLLKNILAIEKKMGRTRIGHQYSDRVIDIDILFYNNDIVREKDLHVPHQRLHLRKFVLVPLNEIAAEYTHPVLKKNVAALLKACKDKLAVKKYKPGPALKYICIEGNIGSGKSTLAKALAEKLNAGFLPEKFEQSHLLPLFYDDPETYAFPLEYSFLISRFEQLAACFEKNSGLIIADFSIYKCLWFAKVNLPEKEYKLFKKHFNAFIGQLPEPGVIVYLKTPVKNLAGNIKKRGRPYEQSIKTSYLKAVDKAYDAGLKENKNLRVLPMKIDVYHPELEISSIKIIENYLKENFG